MQFVLVSMCAACKYLAIIKGIIKRYNQEIIILQVAVWNKYSLARCLGLPAYREVPEPHVEAQSSIALPGHCIKTSGLANAVAAAYKVITEGILFGSVTGRRP